MRLLLPCIFLSVLLLSCGEKKTSQTVIVQDSAFAGKGSFAFDLAFLQKYKSVIELGEPSNPARVLIVKDYQARVMTSTARGDMGNSFGWINYALIESGAVKPHFNPVGGEDRFWIGPEGGQYSVFFKKGAPFNYDNWQVPPLIDTDTFSLVSVSSKQALFQKSGTVTNYHGFTFHFNIQRQINLLNDAAIENIFGISTKNLSAVAYQSTNSMTNTGAEEWTKENGLLSIWILGMFTPSDQTTIVIPHDKQVAPGKAITDDYFGAIPSRKILKKDEVIMLKGDGKSRSKIGIAPSLARNIIGSYNAEKHILTLVKYDLEKTDEYVNSKWEMQKDPFKGDAVFAYNDGPLSDSTQLGPFFELESSSGAKELRPKESIVHRHITIHLEGDEHLLSIVARQTLGVSLAEIINAFKSEENL